MRPSSDFCFAAYGSSSSIVTIYALYIPIFIMFMKHATDLGTVKRYVAPILGICGSVFMVIAAFYAHGFQPYQAAAQAGGFACPIVFYLIVFAVVIVIGLRFYNRKNE